MDILDGVSKFEEEVEDRALSSSSIKLPSDVIVDKPELRFVLIRGRVILAGIDSIGSPLRSVTG